MNRNRTILALIFSLGVYSTALGEDDFISQADREFPNVNQIGLMINNNGLLGTNLPTNQSPPSFEYPLGTDIERMIRGGIWIGAINSDGEPLVSTATLDESYSSQDLAEFFEGPRIEKRSTLANSEFEHPDAVSELDLVCFFEDTDEGRVEGHHPLPVRVNLETYAWSFQPLDQMIILSYTITNIGQRRLEDVYVGIYAEMITCSKAFSGSFPGDCFDTKWIEFDTDRRMMANRYHVDDSLLPGWGAFSTLGSSPEPIGGKTTTYEWWPWNPDAAEEATDSSRYAVMSSGIVDPTVIDGVMVPDTTVGAVKDPVSMISTGPYRFLDPDSSVTIVFAALGGRNWDDLIFRADWAQETYDAGYLIPLPPPSPGLLVDPGPNSLRLFWDAFPETIPDPVLEDSLDFQGYRIYMSRDNIDYVEVAEFDGVDTIGFNVGYDSVLIDSILFGDQYEYVIIDGDVHIVIDGHMYKYTYEIPSLKDGFKYFVGVTSFDKGSTSSGVPSLESGVSQNRTIAIPGTDAAPDEGGAEVIVFPNPYRGEAVWDGQYDRERLIYFANLPMRCTIRIFTLAGDKVDQIDFDSDSYQGRNAAAVYDSDFRAPQMSGGLAAWDLLSSEDQAIASGLYIFSVQNLESGDTEVGKFLVIR